MECTPELPSADNTTAPERSFGVQGATFYNLFKDENLILQSVEIDATGPYQAKNITTVLQCYEMLVQIKPLSFLKTYEVLVEGLKNLRPLTQFIGRWQIIGENPTILCDSAHNEAGLRLAFEAISKSFEVSKNIGGSHRLHIITGFVNDKDVDKALGFFPTEARYYFAKANIPRGLEAALLREKAATFGLNGRGYISVRQALKAAKRAAAPEDLILVIGSIFVVGEVV